MMSFLYRLVLFLSAIFISSTVFAAQNPEEILRLQLERQKALQQQAVAQQMALQKQALVEQQKKILEEQQKAYQQQIAIQQQQIQQIKFQQFQAAKNKAAQEQELYNQALQTRAAQEAAYRQTVQQKAYQQAMVRQMNQQMQQEAAYNQAAQQNLKAVQNSIRENAQSLSRKTSFPPSQMAGEVSDLEHIWKDLEISSEIWPKMLDREPKELTVSRFIESYKKNGIVISKPAAYYVDVIDSMMRQSGAAIAKNPFKDVLKIAAIVEYDFNNGLDKDQMALKILGQQGFEANKKRLGR